jgi:SAM-dependent methyltransferase
MTLTVLASKLEIARARSELRHMGASALDSPVVSLARRVHILRGIKMGDMVKSWDVLATVKFLNAHIDKTDPVLDIGCYASEINSALHKLGYTNLSGADLNPDLPNMPHQTQIKYQVTDFKHTHFADASFRAITSISVIEHGFDPHPLLREMSRLLVSNGYFIASFDYWPEKINTADTKFFDMDWKIFSKKEVEEFIEMAATYGFTPVGELMFDAQDRPIECGGRTYTFGWLALRKR